MIKHLPPRSIIVMLGSLFSIMLLAACAGDPGNPGNPGNPGLAGPQVSLVCLAIPVILAPQVSLV